MCCRIYNIHLHGDGHELLIFQSFVLGLCLWYCKYYIKCEWKQIKTQCTSHSKIVKCLPYNKNFESKLWPCTLQVWTIKSNSIYYITTIYSKYKGHLEYLYLIVKTLKCSYWSCHTNFFSSSYFLVYHCFWDWERQIVLERASSMIGNKLNVFEMLWRSFALWIERVFTS